MNIHVHRIVSNFKAISKDFMVYSKRFVKVHLHCIVSNLTRINKMLTLLLLEEFLRTPMRKIFLDKSKIVVHRHQ